MPNKKKPRIRNRPRNKANRLKLLENPNENQNDNNEAQEEEEEANQKEFNDPASSRETLVKATNADGMANEEDDDDDMPDLIEETVAANQAHDSKAKSPLKEQQHYEDPLDNFKKIMQSKFLQKNPQQADAKTKPITKTKEKSKEIQSKSATTANDEKNAFIQNLQKKMEAMMANGKAEIQFVKLFLKKLIFFFYLLS